MNRAPRRSGLRWAVIAICIVCLGSIAGVALLIFLAGRSSSGAMQNIGESWLIEELPKPLPEPGPTPRNLYRSTRGRRVLVDYVIEQFRFYPPDCVVYQTAREAHHIFAVCGDRVPVGVASASVATWEFEDDGLRRVSDPHLRDGQLVQTVEVLSLDMISQAAKRQPPFQRAWAKSVRFDVNRPLIEPMQSETPVDVNGKSRNGSPPLLTAVWHHEPDVVDALLRAGNSAILRFSSSFARSDALRKFLNLLLFPTGYKPHVLTRCNRTCPLLSMELLHFYYSTGRWLTASNRV